MNAKTLLPLVALAMVVGGRPTMYTLAQDAALPDPGASAPSASSPTVHLLKKDRLVEGRLTEEPDGYVIEQQSASNPGRTARFKIPKGELVASYADMETFYQHKRSEIAENDPHEHMMLARWCLSHGLKDHAHEHLEVVNRLLPGSREAQAMLTNLKSQVEREQVAAQAPADSAVRMASTTAGDVDGPAKLPADIRREAIQQARETFSGRGAPVVFDLPPALAMKRAQEFNQGVHLVLQNKCASCHHERSGSSFQLIQVQRRSDHTKEVTLFNLDAVLRLVDPEEPSHSQLLVSSLMPHKPNNRPILMGQNDRNYRILSAWVHSLKSNGTLGDPAAMPQGFASNAPGAGQAGNGERFAGNRPEAAIPATNAGAMPGGPALGIGATPPMEFPTEAVAPQGKGVGPAIPGAPTAPMISERGTAGPPIPGMGSLPAGAAPVPAPAPAAASPAAAPGLPDAPPATKSSAPAKPIKINNKALDAFLRKGS